MTDEQPEAKSKDEETGRLKKLALRGSVFEIGGYIVSYGLRFVNSTVIRSLLFPAAFGLMEVINGVSFGLIMLSDVGIQQAIIQNERGEEQLFLDTAWTIHVIRGIALWIVACLISYPASLIAGQPEIAYLMPVASLSIVTLGFHTTAEFTLRRRMLVGRIILMDVICQIATMIVTLTWAYLDPTVWALVAGGLVNAGVRLGFSYYLGAHVGYRNRFAWDKVVRKEIWDFGKWITLGSSVSFASTWGDRLLLVAFLGVEVSGIYATAVLLAEAAGAALDRVIGSVFYPLFARVGRSGTDRLREVYYAARLRFDALTMIAAGGLGVLGPWVVELLLDERYQDAGWMLRVLCLRTATIAVVSPAETCLTSLGHTKYGFYQNLVRASWILIGVPLGYWFGGVVGVVGVTATSGFPALIVLWPKLRALKILRIEREVVAWVFFAIGIGLGLLALMVLPEAVDIRAWLREAIL